MVAPIPQVGIDLDHILLGEVGAQKGVDPI